MRGSPYKVNDCESFLGLKLEIGHPGIVGSWVALKLAILPLLELCGLCKGDKVSQRRS